MGDGRGLLLQRQKILRTQTCKEKPTEGRVAGVVNKKLPKNNRQTRSGSAQSEEEREEEAKKFTAKNLAQGIRNVVG